MMLSQKDIEYIAMTYEDDGYPYTAEYIRKYGPEEPLYGMIFTGSDVKKREERAKECLQKGKTATELGLPMNFEGVKSG